MDPKEFSAKRYILSAEDKQFYEDNGYVVIKGLVEPSILDNMRKRFLQYARNELPKGMTSVIEDVSLMKTSKNPEDYVNKLNCLSFDEVFMTYSEHPVILDVVAQFLGEDNIKVVNSMLINKPPGSPWHPPHQDVYNVPLKPVSKIMTTWTAIDDATAENGCVFVIPGSHKHQEIFDEKPVDGLVKNFYYSISDVEGVAPEDKRVKVPVGPGETVFMHSLCVHGSFANTSQKYRKAITCIYAASSTELFDVKGTMQEPFAVHVEKELLRRGLPISFIDFWKPRTKDVIRSYS